MYIGIQVISRFQFSLLILFLEDSVAPTSAIDIYAFGMCALETAAIELVGNGETGTQVTQEVIAKNIDALDDELQKVSLLYYRYTVQGFF